MIRSISILLASVVCVMAQPYAYQRNPVTTNIAGTPVIGSLIGLHTSGLTNFGTTYNYGGPAIFDDGIESYADLYAIGGRFASLTVSNVLMYPSVYNNNPLTVHDNLGSPALTVRSNGLVVVTNIQQELPAWDDVRISLGVLSSPSATPGRGAFVGGTFAYAFDKDSDEQLNGELQTPHGIMTNNSLGIRFHIHFSGITAPTQTSNVVWGIEYAAANPSVRYPLATTTIYATNGISVATNHVIAIFPTITGMKESAVIVFRLFRDADNASDTYGGDAFGLSVDAHFPRKSFGSVSEFGDY